MYDIIVVGAGAAGMTSALYALRSGKSVLVLEGESFGGQAALSPKIENFPTVKQISGSELMENLMGQIEELGAEIEFDKVEKIEKKDGHFIVTSEYTTYESKSVIIASGAKHRHIGVDRELELVGKGISYCAVCDGAFFNGEEVALIGDANTALQYAILLSNSCKKVYVLTLFDKFFGEAKLVKTLRERENVEIHHNLSLQEFLGKDELEGLRFENTQDKSQHTFKVKGCFICIGQVPNNKAFEGLVEMDKNGYIIANEDCKTSVDGIFVAGDCRTKQIRQLTTATADGAVAGLAACSYIDAL